MRSATRPAPTSARCRSPARRCSAPSRRRVSGNGSLQLLQPDSLGAAAAALGNGSVALAGGTELVPLLRSRLVEADTLVDVRGLIPRGVQGTTIGAGTTLAELEADPEIPAALREACTLAASPQLRSMGTIGGDPLQGGRRRCRRAEDPPSPA